MSLTSRASWPAFVINLEDEVRRRAHMDGQLRSMGIAAEFVAAVSGAALSASDRAAYDRGKALRVYGGDMIDAELGCYLSHYRLYRRMVDQDIDLALIMEDDIEISPALPGIVHALADVPEWLVVRLELLRSRVLHPKTGGGGLVRRPSGQLREET